MVENKLNKKPSSLDNEFQLVLMLSRYYQPSHSNSFPLKKIRQRLVNCDVKRFWKKLDQARTWPMVYKNIKSYNISLPNELYHNLKTIVEKNTYQSLQHHRLLKQLQQKMWQEKIKCFSLKGSFLAEKLFVNIGLRHSNDIDLLVNPKQLVQARKLLDTMGYTRADTKYFGTEEDKYLQTITHHSLYIHIDTGTLLELHWRPAGSNTIMLFSDRFWDKFELTQKSSCHLLSDDELFIYLCFHGSKHMWSRLKWLNDIEQLMSQIEWNWSQLLQKSCEYHCENCLLLAVLLVHELYQKPLSKTIKKRLEQKPDIYGLADKIIKFSFNDDYFTKHNKMAKKLITFNSFKFNLQICSSYSCKLQIFYKLFQPNMLDMQIIRLPNFLFFVYYLIRPFRIAFEIVTHFSQKIIFQVK